MIMDGNEGWFPEEECGSYLATVVFEAADGNTDASQTLCKGLRFWYPESTKKLTIEEILEEELIVGTIEYGHLVHPILADFNAERDRRYLFTPWFPLSQIFYVCSPHLRKKGYDLPENPIHRPKAFANINLRQDAFSHYEKQSLDFPLFLRNRIKDQYFRTNRWWRRIPNRFRAEILYRILQKRGLEDAGQARITLLGNTSWFNEAEWELAHLTARRVVDRIHKSRAFPELRAWDQAELAHGIEEAILWYFSLGKEARRIAATRLFPRLSDSGITRLLGMVPNTRSTRMSIERIGMVWKELFAVIREHPRFNGYCDMFPEIDIV